MKLRKQAHLGLTDPTHQVMRADLAGMIEACGGQHFRQRMQRIPVKIKHAFGLFGHHQGALEQRILRRDADGTTVGIAGQRLNAPEGEHEPSRGIYPVRTQGARRSDVEGADYLSRSADPDPVAQARADQGVVHKEQAFPHGHAEMI